MIVDEFMQSNLGERPNGILWKLFLDFHLGDENLTITGHSTASGH